MMGMFLGALDQTIVSTAIRTIADDLHGLSVQAWVTTAYLITSTITTPIYGKLGDLYGRKKLFMFAITVFIVGSALCSFATSMYMLAGVPRRAGDRRRRPVHAGARDHRRHRLAARARQLHRLLHGRLRHLERARPGDRRLLRRPGGDPRHDRLALGVPGQRADRHRRAVRGLPHPAPATTRRREARIDWWGAAALVVAPGAAADRGRAGPRVGLGLAAGRWPATSSARSAWSRFVLRRGADGRRRADPAADLPDPRGRGRRSRASVIVGVAMFGGIMLLPLYMQIVHGASPTEAGFLMLPMVVGMMSRLDRLRPGHLAHRPDPAVPDRRLGADRRGAAAALADHAPTPTCCW